MPLVKYVTLKTPAGSILVPPSVALAINDLSRAWFELDKQAGYVLPRRLAKATYWRARFADAVRV
jgi:hypothetical protein